MIAPLRVYVYRYVASAIFECAIAEVHERMCVRMCVLYSGLRPRLLVWEVMYQQCRTSESWWLVLLHRPRGHGAGHAARPASFFVCVSRVLRRLFFR